MSLIWNLEFLNHNSQRSYPLAEQTSARDITDSLTIPDSFLIDLVLPIDGRLSVSPVRFFLYQLGIYSTGYRLVIGYASDGGVIVAAEANIARQSHVEHNQYPLAGVGDFIASTGSVTIGKLAEIDKLPTGLFTFELEHTQLERTAIRPMLSGVSFIRVVNGNDVSAPIYGPVELVAGNNVSIAVAPAVGDTNRIQINAIDATGFNADCTADTAPGQPIYFINGEPPQEDGNFQFRGDMCLSIEAIENGLQLRDDCSQPCCGCEELEALVSQIQQFGEGAAAVRTFATLLVPEVQKMSQVIFSSQFAGNGCIDC